MKRLLWISDSPYWEYVGQSKVGREVTHRLKKDFSLTYGGFYDVTKVGHEGDHNGIRVINIRRESTDLLVDTIHKTQPEIVLLSHDCWEFPGLPILKQKFKNTKFVGWFTIDGEPLDRKWKNILNACDMIISPTKYGKDVLEDQYFYLDVQHIPYGLDHSIFHVLEDAQRQELRNKQNIVTDFNNKFCALYVGQNYTRKNLGAALDGWRRFAADKDDVAFVCVTHTRRVKKGEWENLPTDYDLNNWTDPSIVFIDQVVSQRDIAHLMQMSDVFLLPTIGEAPGLPLMEAMACGSIPIVTDFSGPTDFCTPRNAALLDGVDMWAQTWNVKRRIVDPGEVQRGLEMIYTEWKVHKSAFHRRRQAAIAAVRQFDWDTTAEKMKGAFERVAAEKQIGKVNRAYRI